MRHKIGVRCLFVAKGLPTSTFAQMVRHQIVKAACTLMLIGFAAGFIVQIELLKPRASFLSPRVWPKLMTLHAWATSISLVIICLSTVSFIQQRKTWRLWGIWLGFAVVPIVFGLLLILILRNSPNESYYLSVSLFVTAYRHAFGIAILMAALGGLSAMNKMKLKRISLRVSAGFALLITLSGFVLTVLQASIGVSGIPKGYIEYPYALARVHFYSSLAAIMCLALSVAYLIYLWRCPIKTEKAVEVF